MRSQNDRDGRPVLIAFEGGEGTGKSTQARLLAERLGAVLTREPGGTAIGEQIRALVLDHATGDLDPRTEALLMAAARAQHVAEVVAPALAEGRPVVTDRYRDSSVAYQGHGRGLPLDLVQTLSDCAGAPPADIVVLLVVSPAVRTERLRASGAPLDRIEVAGDDFHKRVDAGFLELAKGDPDRWVVIDGGGEVDQVAAEIWAAVQPRIRQ